MITTPSRRIPSLIAACVLGFVCLVRLVAPDFFERLECITYDMRVRQALKSAPAVATNLGFVFIDERSIAAVQDNSLGLRFGLYWPRQVYGRLVNELAIQGAKTTAFDVLFGDLRPDHPPIALLGNQIMDSDEYFAYEIGRASNVVLAVSGDLRVPDLFTTNAAALGDISADKDRDGILRRAKAFRLYREWHPAFKAVEADPGYGVDLRYAQVKGDCVVMPRLNGEQITIELDSDGTFNVADFYGDDLPSGVPARARPFIEKRVWHMGIIIAARELGLDLEKAQIDLERGRIALTGPGVQRVIPVDRQGRFYIDWCLPPNHPGLFHQAVHQLLAQHLARTEGKTEGLLNQWAGRVAVVGSSAMGNDLTDRGATPLRSDTLLVSKHWNVANSLIIGRFVKRVGLPAEMILIALMAAAATVLTLGFRPLLAFGLVVALAAAYVASAVMLYTYTRWWAPVTFPVLGGLLAHHLALVTWRVVFEQADKRRVKSVFSKMVSPKIVDELLVSESLKLGGARREITVMFADVRGFTELTDRSQEQVSEYVARRKLSGEAAEAAYDEQARETLQTVNLYLGLVADTIIKNDGTLDKFIGDCVMAFWGAPTSNSRHALACVRAAIAAQRALAQLNDQRAIENRRREEENVARLAKGLEPLAPIPLLLLGSGINTGTAIVGLMGSEAETCNYTVFGREVNLASRLESLSGRGRIFITRSTYDHLLRDDPELAATCVALPPVTVKGIRSEVAVFEVPWKQPDMTKADGTNPSSANSANPTTSGP